MVAVLNCREANRNLLESNKIMQKRQNRKDRIEGRGGSGGMKQNETQGWMISIK